MSTPEEQAPDPAGTSAQVGMSSDAIAKTTSRSLEQWRKIIDSAGGAQLDHKALVAVILEHLPEVSNRHWWAQSVAISYEQATGVRVPGQLGDGTFAANASRTLTGTMDEVLERWVAYVGTPTELNGVPVTQGPVTSSSEKWRYWRTTVGAGQRINVTINEKPGGKVTLAVQHPGLDSLEERDAWKTFWRAYLKGLPA